MSLSGIMAADFRQLQADDALSLTWQPPSGDPVVFAAMVETREPERDQFASSPSDDTAATIRVLRADVAAPGGAKPKAQDIFTAAGGVRMQVVKVTDRIETPFIYYRAKVVT